MNEKAAIKKILQGRSSFIGDIRDKDAYSVKVVRSTVPRGTIRGIAFPELPLEVRVIRAADIPGKNALSVFGVEVPILAEGRVSYKGEPVLLLAGPDERVLEHLIDRIVVDYEKEEPFLNFENPAAEQIAYRRDVEAGNVDRAFASAARVVTGEYTTGMQEHYYCEPQGVYIRLANENSGLAVSSSSRWPFHVHKTLREVLRVPNKFLSVSVPADPDRSLDGKLWYPSLVAAHAGLAALLLRKNTKILYSREEDFLFTPKRAPALLRYKAGLDGDGLLLAAEIEILLNVGAYPVFTKETVDRAAAASLGGYHCPNLRIKVLGVVTNLPPMGPFSGMGGAMSLFAVEAFADSLRGAAESDPIAWKKANLVSAGRGMITGGVSRSSLPDPALFDLARGISDFSRKHAALELARKRRPAGGRAPDYLRGIGIALGCQGSGFFGSGETEVGASLEVSIDTDGKAQISGSAVPGSYALHQIWRRIAGESLGCNADEIRIPEITTANGTDCGPSVFSRNITVVTKLLEECCEGIKKKRFRNPLPLSASKTYRPQRAAAWNDEAFAGEPYLTLAWAVAVAELRVDPLTFRPEITGLWLAVDAGAVLDEKEARRTLEVEIQQAVGWTLHEKIAFRDGGIPREQFIGYRIPSSLDAPTPHIAFLEGSGKRPVKGIGEIALSCVPAALVLAFGQAAGAPVGGIPIGPKHGAAESEVKS